MGSFDMNASFSKMPIVDKTTVIICLKRHYNGRTELIPLTYPVVGHYWDYGEVHDFEQSEVTDAICKYFEMDNMNDVIEFIYDMTIHNDYEEDLDRIKNGEEPYDNDKFNKYVDILNRLRKSSGIEIKTEEEIIKEINDKYVEGWKNLDNSKLEEVKSFWLEHKLSRNQKLKELLDSYELALFYENTPVFDALCVDSDVDDKGMPYSYYESTDDLSAWSRFLEDKNNVFIITKDCIAPETVEIKKKLARLYLNFETESKHFELTETNIMGQDSYPYMWYSYGKAVQELFQCRIKD